MCGWLRCVLVSQAVLLATATPSSAKIEATVCDGIRNQARAEKLEKLLWFGLDANDQITSLRGETYKRLSLDKIVYLHARQDKSSASTVMAVKIKMYPAGDPQNKDWIRAKNNFKSKAVGTEIQLFQDFHNGKKKNHDLLTNFHLTEGFFQSNIPFTTSSPDDRRKQLAYGDVATGEDSTYRAYLFHLDGVDSNGSCVDFKPFFLEGTNRAKIQVIDLLPEVESDNFYSRSIDLSIEE